MHSTWTVSLNPIPVPCNLYNIHSISQTMKLPVCIYPHRIALCYTNHPSTLTVGQLVKKFPVFLWNAKVHCSEQPTNWPYLQPDEFSLVPLGRIPIWLSGLRLYFLSSLLPPSFNEIPVCISLLYSPFHLSNFTILSSVFLWKTLNVSLNKVNIATLGPSSAETDQNFITSE